MWGFLWHFRNYFDNLGMVQKNGAKEDKPWNKAVAAVHCEA